ncbi:hypothetical protein SAMN04487895_101650 [Paenibacillus sophorae]|uniref:Uncharacterized protein n=1 Tax=Paenibacillus sophorae TaxID=1333845 RepID=A0A1H8GWJ3_9BACL|nr:hypothetical protein [Paenibacillus sophorae]QWU14347.1 hypothetical protein KP014_20795 [Paenibacillus sophorae]SEN47638.1 hypothetical protein SAMN04487895_101650 [Paenibacillus sophorae]
MNDKPEINRDVIIHTAKGETFYPLKDYDMEEIAKNQNYVDLGRYRVNPEKVDNFVLMTGKLTFIDGHTIVIEKSIGTEHWL